MTLWTKNGSYPADLPWGDYDDDGMFWGDLANSEDARAATHWNEAPEMPAFDPDIYWLSWDYIGNWVITAFTPEELAQQAAQKLLDAKNAATGQIINHRSILLNSMAVTGAQVTATYDRCAELYAAIGAATTVAAVQAIAVDAGWPG